MCEVAVAAGIKQAEAGEVTVGAELLGSGGEQQEAFHFSGELIDDLVFGAGLVGVPVKVVGLIDDEQVPAGIEGLGGALLRGCEKAETGEDELGVEKGIGAFIVVFDGLAAIFIKETEQQVEAAEEFDKPLVQKSVWDEDQDTGGAACEVEAMQDEAGFDGLAQAHFVCKQDAWQEAAGDLAGDGHLMRDQIDAPAEEAAGGGAIDGAAALKRAQAEFIGTRVIDLPCEQAVLRFAEADGVRKLGLVDISVRRLINDEAILFSDVRHGVLRIVVRFDAVAHLEANAPQGGGLDGVLAVFTGGWKENLHATEAGFQDHTESEFWFRVAYPSLPCCRSVH